MPGASKLTNNKLLNEWMKEYIPLKCKERYSKGVSSEKLPTDHQGVLLGGGEQQVGWVG